MRWLCTVVLLVVVAPASAAPEPVRADEVLPAVRPWSGASEALALPPDSDDPWLTPGERSGLTETATLAATWAWLDRLDAASREVAVVPIGETSEGRLLRMVVAARSGGVTPATVDRAGRAVVLVVAGIHSGEIDGKDAALMLLRDLTVGGRLAPLLDRAVLLVVPIFNLDGHEAGSTWGRVNQRGPLTQGWRTTAQNLNLNRDFAKADAPEMRALLRVLERWQPDLMVDVHVTDGGDFQYDTNWGGSFRHSPSLGRWVEERLRPRVDDRLRAAGHLSGPLLFTREEGDPMSGLALWAAAPPRLSDGYGDVRHVATLLVENHSLKPFRRRVLATRVLLEAVLAGAGETVEELRRASRDDRARRAPTVVLDWAWGEPDPARPFPFAGIVSRRETSALSGGTWLRWLPETRLEQAPLMTADRPKVSVTRPVAYWVPAAWGEVIERLHVHGIWAERLDAARTVEVEMLRVPAAAMEPTPTEGRARVALGAPPEVERRLETFPAGSLRVPTDQPLGDLAVALLEPEGPDSFFQWGFFLAVLNRTEYVEPYIIEPMAALMLERDADLAAAFAARRDADPALAADPEAIRQWFYARTPYFDQRWRLYPVGRELAGPSPLEGNSVAFAD